MATYKGVKGKAKVKKNHTAHWGVYEVVINDEKPICCMAGTFIWKEEEIETTSIIKIEYDKNEVGIIEDLQELLKKYPNSKII